MIPGLSGNFGCGIWQTKTYSFFSCWRIGHAFGNGLVTPYRGLWKTSLDADFEVSVGFAWLSAERMAIGVQNVKIKAMRQVERGIRRVSGWVRVKSL